MSICLFLLANGWNSQCEALSEETGCWLVLGAHAGVNSSAIHFVSNALRRDALDDATNIIGDFLNTTSRMKKAKFISANELVTSLDEAKAEAAARAEEIAAKDKEIAALKSRYEGSQAGL